MRATRRITTLLAVAIVAAYTAIALLHARWVLRDPVALAALA